MTILTDPRRYSNYREFLRALFQLNKSHSKDSSMKSFSAKLGFSESSLRMILSGKRDLTVHNIHVLASKLRMSQVQTEIFEAMILRDQSETRAERSYHVQKLKILNSLHSMEDVRVSSKQLLSEWYFPELLLYLNERQLAELGLEEVKQIASQLGLTLEKAEAAIAKVLQMDLSVTAVGSSEMHLAFLNTGSISAQKDYVKKCLQKCLHHVEADYKSGRSLYSIKSLPFTEDGLKEFGQEYKALVEKYMKNSKSGSAKSKDHEEGPSSSNRSVFKVVLCALKTLE